VNGLAAAGADLLAYPASLGRAVPAGVRVSSTLELGKLRMPFRIVGTARAVAMHDLIVARRLKSLVGKIDIIHTWPTGALQTLKTAEQLGIPTVLERPNANTRFAMEVVKEECDRMGIALPPDHEHAFDAAKLSREEEEYKLATRLLCPSDFVVKTFVDLGYPRKQLIRHIYGYDPNVYYPPSDHRGHSIGLTVLFVGVCAVRKGIHYALEAWLKSPASEHGTFLIAGEFLPAYQEKLAGMLAHKSVKVLGHRNDVPELMRKSDILILPSIEEGFGLVIAEAMGSGCVPLASEACSEICEHMKTGLMHEIGDVETINQHITMLHRDRALLERFRIACLNMAPKITWNAAGVKLLDAYRETVEDYKAGLGQVSSGNMLSEVTRS
jgi:glycosyltransferase involved in cell wall biosynthesis